jgi:ubiquinone/menaquinone biosynthesis C-methylase UbiE
MAEMGWFDRRLANFGNVRRANRVLRAVGPYLQLPSSCRILELGAGRGGLSALLEERFRPARLVVSDFDPRQLDAARAFLGRRWDPLPASIEVREVDARSLLFESASFDCVFAIEMLHHVEPDHFDYQERPKALAEIRRVLAPGGKLVYLEFSRTTEMRQTLKELGFVPHFERRGRRGRELAVYRSPDGAGVPGDGRRSRPNSPRAE